MNENYWSKECDRDRKLEKQDLACDMIEDAEVMQEFDDVVWISVDKDLWNEYNDNNQGEKE
jgi:hypothetical protein